MYGGRNYISARKRSRKKASCPSCLSLNTQANLLAGKRTTKIVKRCFRCLTGESAHKTTFAKQSGHWIQGDVRENEEQPDVTTLVESLLPPLLASLNVAETLIEATGAQSDIDRLQTKLKAIYHGRDPTGKVSVEQKQRVNSATSEYLSDALVTKKAVAIITRRFDSLCKKYMTLRKQNSTLTERYGELKTVSRATKADYDAAVLKMGDLHNLQAKDLQEVAAMNTLMQKKCTDVVDNNRALQEEIEQLKAMVSASRNECEHFKKAMLLAHETAASSRAKTELLVSTLEHSKVQSQQMADSQLDQTSQNLDLRNELVQVQEEREGQRRQIKTMRIQIQSLVEQNSRHQQELNRYRETFEVRVAASAAYPAVTQSALEERTARTRTTPSRSPQSRRSVPTQQHTATKQARQQQKHQERPPLQPYRQREVESDSFTETKRVVQAAEEYVKTPTKPEGQVKTSPEPVIKSPHMNSVELLIARLDAKRKQRPLSAGEEQIRQEALWVLGTLQRAATSPHKGRGPTQRSQEQKQLFVQDSDDEASSGSDEEAMRMADESMRNAAVTDTLSGGSSDEDELFEHVFEDLSPEVRELEQKLSARMKHGRKAAAPAAQDTSDGKQTFLFNNSSAEQSWLHDLSQPKDDVPAKFNRFKYSQPDLP